MRYFIGCVALLFAVAGCSGTEPIQQETEPAEPIQQESLVPAWYDAGIHSSSDSLAIHGFALASAMDSTRAVELSTQTALENLRFEIDRITEEVRKELADTPGMGDDYDSPMFIIHLRNTISDLPLHSATIDRQHEISDRGIHYSYMKASILRTKLPDLFGNELNDDAFFQKIGFVSQ